METNRNFWNEKEENLLISLVKKTGNSYTACEEASTKLGRTAGACRMKYFQLVRDGKIKSSKFYRKALKSAEKKVSSREQIDLSKLQKGKKVILKFKGVTLIIS